MNMKIFKKKISMNSWWEATTSAIVGTVVGIILTFGTTEYIENRHQKEMERMTVLMVVSGIDEYVRKMEGNIAEMEHADSLFRYMLAVAPDKVGDVDKDTLAMFVNCLGLRVFNLNDKTTERIFSANTSTWENIGNPQFINNVGKCFSLVDAIDRLYEEMSESKFGIIEDFCSGNNRLGMSSTDELKAVLVSPKARWGMEKY